MSTPGNVHPNSPVYAILGSDGRGVSRVNPCLPGSRFHTGSSPWPVVIQLDDETTANQVAFLNDLIEDTFGFDMNNHDTANALFQQKNIQDYINRHESLNGPYYPVVWAGVGSHAVIYRNYMRDVLPIVDNCAKRVTRRVENLWEAIAYMILRANHISQFPFTPKPSKREQSGSSGIASPGRATYANNNSHTSTPRTPVRGHLETLPLSASSTPQSSGKGRMIPHAADSRNEFIFSNIRDLSGVIGVYNKRVLLEEPDTPLFNLPANDYLKAHGYTHASRAVIAQALEDFPDSKDFSFYLSSKFGTAYTEAEYIWKMLNLD